MSVIDRLQALWEDGYIISLPSRRRKHYYCNLLMRKLRLGHSLIEVM